MNDSKKLLESPFRELRKLSYRFAARYPVGEPATERTREQNTGLVLHALTLSEPELLAELAAIVEKHRKRKLVDTPSRKKLVEHLARWDGSEQTTRAAIDLACRLQVLQRSDWARNDPTSEDIEAVRVRLEERAAMCERPSTPTLARKRGETLARELCASLGLELGRVDDMFSRL